MRLPLRTLFFMCHPVHSCNCICVTLLPPGAVCISWRYHCSAFQDVWDEGQVLELGRIPVYHWPSSLSHSGRWQCPGSTSSCWRCSWGYHQVMGWFFSAFLFLAHVIVNNKPTPCMVVGTVALIMTWRMSPMTPLEKCLSLWVMKSTLGTRYAIDTLVVGRCVRDCDAIYLLL